MAREKKAQIPRTSGSQLRSIVKSARDTMRKDKGLSGDLERIREDEALLPAILDRAFEGEL